MSKYLTQAIFLLFSLVFIGMWLAITGHDGSIYASNMIDGGKVYLPVDSNLYISKSLENLQSLNSLGMGTNYLPVLIGDFSEWLLPESPYNAIYTINIFLLNMSFWAFQSSARIIKGKAVFGPVIFWMSCPLLFFITTGINKEILSLFSVTFYLYFFLKYIHTKKMTYLLGILCVMALAFFIRNMLFIAQLGLLIYFFVQPRRPLLLILLSVSLILPIAMSLTDGFLFGKGFYNFNEVAAIKSMQTARIFDLSTQLYNYPLGFFVSYLLNGAIYILAPGINPSYWTGLVERINPAEIFLMLSSLYMSLLLVFLLIRGRLKGLSIIHVFIYGFSVLIFLLPISQHRYLIPIYPALFLLFYFKKIKKQ
jgi:hypothetical protein